MDWKVESSFGTIACRVAGAGPTAVFVHGVLMNGWLWHGVVDEVAAVRRCVAPDLLGHGETSCRDPHQDLSFGPQADMLAEVIEGLDCGPVDLVGNDSGGAICQILAGRHPHLVRTMALTNCDTHGNLAPEPLEAFAAACRRGRVLEMFEPMLTDMDRARSLLATTLQHPASLDDDTLRRFITPLVRNERRERSVERWMVDLTDRDLADVQPALARLQAPTLLVWGTDDVFFPVEQARALARLLPDSELVELPGARLFHPLEHPAQLAVHLRRFWS